jgi:hypothetical protein
MTILVIIIEVLLLRREKGLRRGVELERCGGKSGQGKSWVIFYVSEFEIRR